MNWTQLTAGIKLAMETIRSHKTRAFLTVLGVIIGTGTIIGVGSIITGFDGAITNILRSFGTDTLVVFKFKLVGNSTPEERHRKPLTYQNAMAIAERCPNVKAVSPYLFPWDMNSRAPQIYRIKYKGNDMYQIEMGGTEDSYAAGGQAEMKSGRFLTDLENRHHMPVVVIGEDVEKALFSGQAAVGKEVEVNGHVAEVIGVMKRPAASMPGQEDKRVLLPYFTMQKMFPNAKENMIIVAAKPGRMAAAEDEVRAVLRQERRDAYSAQDSFAISNSEQMVQDFRKITAMVAIVMVALSSIGLLVGGIGVMNIMLVSVTERTREIGVRKAIGARRADIVLQFLTEAVVLTGLGGLIGMMFGWLISLASRAIFPTLPTSVPLWAAALGVIVSVGVGLFFGIWPANKAARLDPVEALRYE